MQILIITKALIFNVILNWHSRCLFSAVQCIGHSSRLLRFLAAEKIPCIIISFLVSAATPACSQESAMTLAMAQPASENFTAIRAYPPAAPVLSPVVLAGQNDGQKKTEPEIKNDFPAGTLLEKQSRPGFGDSLLLARENLGSKRSVSLRAGYDQGWGDGSILRKISPDEQEPGFACVKASFSF
jgi:hypothetical protein